MYNRQHNILKENRFGIPADPTEDLENLKKMKRKPVHQYRDHQEITKELVAPNLGSLKYKKLREELKKDNVEFHNYSAKNQRTKKIVVKAVPNVNKGELEETTQLIVVSDQN